MEQLSPSAAITVCAPKPQLLRPHLLKPACSSVLDLPLVSPVSQLLKPMPRACALQEKPPQGEAGAPQLEKACIQLQRPRAAINK